MVDHKFKKIGAYGVVDKSGEILQDKKPNPFTGRKMSLKSRDSADKNKSTNEDLI